MPPAPLGLDVGGANLKAAHAGGPPRTVPFSLWKHPAALPAALSDLLASLPSADLLGVTMTGELCDCFATRRDGVCTILDAVATAAGRRRVRVWTTAGHFMDPVAARGAPLQVAAA